jgi:hypothetical protein
VDQYKLPGMFVEDFVVMPYLQIAVALLTPESSYTQLCLIIFDISKGRLNPLNSEPICIAQSEKLQMRNIAINKKRMQLYITTVSASSGHLHTIDFSGFQMNRSSSALQYSSFELNLVYPLAMTDMIYDESSDSVYIATSNFLPVQIFRLRQVQDMPKLQWLIVRNQTIESKAAVYGLTVLDSIVYVVTNYGTRYCDNNPQLCVLSIYRYNLDLSMMIDPVWSVNQSNAENPHGAPVFFTFDPRYNVFWVLLNCSSTPNCSPASMVIEGPKAGLVMTAGNGAIGYKYEKMLLWQQSFVGHIHGAISYSNYICRLDVLSTRNIDFPSLQ